MRKVDITIVYGVFIGWNHAELAMVDMMPEELYFPTKAEALEKYAEYHAAGVDGIDGGEDDLYPVDLRLEVISAHYGKNKQRICALLNRRKYAAKARILMEWNAYEQPGDDSPVAAPN
jgi:hypothetical protein